MQKEVDKIDVESEEFQLELDKTRIFSEKVRKKRGFQPNPIESENERIFIGLTVNKLSKGEMYCPCFMVIGKTQEERKSTDNRICPCKPALKIEIPKNGKCHCGIFCTQDYVDAFVKADVKEADHSTVLKKENLEKAFNEEEIESDYLMNLLDGRKEGLIDFKLLDVREVRESKAKSISGTDFLIPTSSFYQGVNKITDKKEANIVVYCHSGARSAQVQQLMRSLGFKTVINLNGGISNYGGETE